MEILSLQAQKLTGSQEKGNAKSAKNEGISFLGSVAEAVRTGKIVMPSEVEVARFNSIKNKIGSVGNSGGGREEEDLIDRFLARIKRILEEK
ncbi:MAG: hypothetical protein FD145_717 [Candidatus Saganbacteria bacterium]|uniref:Uncharacterized protein n=1 Tax=Candidatus Saganbacteria bacterium TaxID=2575572 RepID=A0A833L1A2_UNCSA|nr:MAG: hypothetical protein FD145_717 [Candidatus Saganbacteria bacterium]